jgi:hypothetical protein
MGDKSADKIKNDPEIVQKKKNLVADKAKAKEETDAKKKAKLDEENDEEEAFLLGVDEAEAEVRKAPPTKTGEGAAITAIEGVEKRWIDEQETKQKTLRQRGDKAGADAMQPAIDREYDRMRGKKAAREIIDK